jgi:predicted ribosomally synthesized peptide with nif11-like leader
MSEEQIKAFLGKVKGNPLLFERLRAATDDESFVAIAKEAGFSVDRVELSRYLANDGETLSDEELEGVAGGMMKERGDTSFNCKSSADVTLCVTNMSCCNFSAANTCLC